MALIFLNENIVDEYDEISEQDKASLDTLNFIGMNYRAGLNINLVSSNFSPYKKPYKEDFVDKSIKKDCITTHNDFITKAPDDCIVSEAPEPSLEIEESEVLTAVQINNQEGFAKDFVRQVVTNQYKKVLEASKKPPKKKTGKKSMKALMQQSVFHGKSWLGNNFIA